MKHSSQSGFRNSMLCSRAGRRIHNDTSALPQPSESITH